MPQIKRGLRIDDDDQPKGQYEYQNLDAGRKRTNFENNLDDLLFGGAPKPIRKPVQPKEQTKPPVKEQPKKQVIPSTNTNVNPNKSIDSNVNKSTDSKISQVISQTKPIVLDEKSKIQQKSKIDDKKSPGSVNNITSVRSIGIESKIDNKKINNYVEPQAPSKTIVQQPSIEQPKHHTEPKVGKEQKYEVTGSVFNRPAYIRKLKKIAEDFNFAAENTTNHIAVDVVRPFECDRTRMKKFNDANFIDQQFPPNSYSLGYNLRDRNTEWKRHPEITKSSVFGKYIDPNDINPGKLSSPQFLSTLSVLAEMEVNIKRLIEDQKVNSNGFYLVRINVNGVWRYVVVDNKLPFSQGQALGAQSYNDNESELWAALIEKAYAKVYGGYDVFSRNVSREHYLRDLTGSPVRKYLATDNDLPNIIRHAISSGHVIAAVPKQQIVSLGLSPNHSFTVVNCKSNGGLELRNSWGTIEQRSKLNISKEGVFELSSNQAKQFISYVMIAETNNANSSSTIQSRHKAGFYSTYSFKIRNQTHGFLTVSQLDQRLFPQNSYEYSPARLILQKKGHDGSATYINAGFSNSKNLDVQVQLSPGEYEVFVAGQWKSKEFDFYLTFFGQERVDFKRIHTSSSPNKITEALSKLNLETGKRSALGHVNQYIQHHKESNLILVTADNTSEKDYLFNQDFTKVNFSSLLLLNAKNNEDTYENLTEAEILDHKNHANENRKWAVSIEAKGNFTWVISSVEDYDSENFRKWGFR